MELSDDQLTSLSDPVDHEPKLEFDDSEIVTKVTTETGKLTFLWFYFFQLMSFAYLVYLETEEEFEVAAFEFGGKFYDSIFLTIVTGW